METHIWQYCHNCQCYVYVKDLVRVVSTKIICSSLQGKSKLFCWNNKNVVFNKFKNFGHLRPTIYGTKFILLGLTIMLIVTWVLFRNVQFCSGAFLVLRDNRLYWQNCQNELRMSLNWATNSVEQPKENSMGMPQSAPAISVGLAGEVTTSTRGILANFKLDGKWL